MINRPYFIRNVACWCGGGSAFPFCGLKEALGVGRGALLFEETRYGVLRGDDGRLALLPAIGTDLVVAQGHRAGHVLRDAVICGHAYTAVDRDRVRVLFKIMRKSRGQNRVTGSISIKPTNISLK